MNFDTKILLGVVMPALLILGSVYGIASQMQTITLTSEYEYEVYINTDGEIHNVTLEVPFPSDLSEGDISAPEGWNVLIEEDENMLRIEAENISGGELSLSMETDEEIDTLDPWDTEPMLEPGAEFTRVECDSSNDSARLECYNYTGSVYANYDAESGTEVSISIELLGMNSWWLLEDIENEYNDSLSVDIVGDAEGENSGEGLVKTGIGTY